MTTSPIPDPSLSPEDLRKALLAAVSREGGATILWDIKILQKLSDKHWVTQKDAEDVFRNWEILKSTEWEGRSWRCVVEGKNSIGDWMRAVALVTLKPVIRVFPLSCYRCVKPKGK